MTEIHRHLASIERVLGKLEKETDHFTRVLQYVHDSLQKLDSRVDVLERDRSFSGGIKYTLTAIATVAGTISATVVSFLAKYLTVVAVIGLLLASTVEVQADFKCHPLDRKMLTLQLQPNLRAVLRLTPDKAQRAMRWINKQPPKSKETFDTIVVAVYGAPDHVLIVMGRGETACADYTLPHDKYEEFYKWVIYGRDA
jgi:hypothetical protein